MKENIAHDLRPRIAVIGGGISGMASAYEIGDFADVTLFEASDRLGGHAHTVMAGRNGDQPVDMGFIVFNFANYPHLTRLFRDLDVPIEKSNMSFGVSVNDGSIEYSLQNLDKLFAQRRNLANPQMWRLIRDILRFGRRAQIDEIDDALSIGEYMRKLGLGRWFADYYLLPISGAIWSTPTREVHHFPAKALIRFFQNHALLENGMQHQWWTVAGGSINYVEPLARVLAAKGVHLQLSTPVDNVTSTANRVRLLTANQRELLFDAVVFACHSDTAAKLLARDPSAAAVMARSALGDIRYQDNHVVLHRDPNLMPKTPKCWSSWVYQTSGRGADAAIGVTYWMNRLQNIPQSDALFVSLNPARHIDPAMIYHERNFRHPVFDLGAMRAQKDLAAYQGAGGLWFAGAYLRHGFHEDGYAAAMRVARGLRAQYQRVATL